jgi:hypothetical protein
VAALRRLSGAASAPVRPECTGPASRCTGLSPDLSVGEAEVDGVSAALGAPSSYCRAAPGTGEPRLSSNGCGSRPVDLVSASSVVTVWLDAAGAGDDDRIVVDAPSAVRRSTAPSARALLGQHARCALLVAALISLGGCASADEAVRRTDGLPTMVQPECDDTAACAAGFLIDGDFYGLSCGGVRAEVVAREPLARGRYGGKVVEMRAVRGVAPDVLTAVSIPGGACEEGSSVTTPWSMLFGPGADDETARHQAICRATLSEERGRNGCSSSEGAGR